MTLLNHRRAALQNIAGLTLRLPAATSADRAGHLRAEDRVRSARLRLMPRQALTTLRANREHSHRVAVGIAAATCIACRAEAHGAAADISADHLRSLASRLTSRRLVSASYYRH